MGLNVGHRIIAGFGLVIILTLGLGWYQLSNVRRMSDLSSRIVEEDFDTLRLLRQIGNAKRHEALLLEQAWTAYLLGKAGVPAKDPAVFENEWTLSLERHRGLVGDLEKWSEEQEQAAETEARRALLRQLDAVAKSERQNLEDTVTTGKALFALLQSGALTQFPAQYEVLQRLRDESSATGARAEDLIVQLASNAKQRILDLEQNLREVSLPVLVGVLVLGLVVAFLIYRSIATPLAEFMRFVERVGAGDLTRSLTRVGRDEIGRLGGHLNAMVASLGEVARQTRAATENLNAAAAEMQASVQQHAAGASEQNAAIQQITTTLTEITRSGAQVSERARAVATAAEAAAAASKSGLHAVNETTRAMDAIREQAEKVAGNVVALTEKTQSIGAIIATVNDLSERSNLLALNAAIEAAAAGEHGRSFAVVADEIKNLASQAKEATAEVRAILSDIQHGIGVAVMQTEEAVKRVEAGKQQAVATEQTINELTRSVEQSVATFEQIVAATNQQQVGIEQVTQSLHGIREASEQMAAGSRDVGKAASSLAALSSQLQRLTERYQV